MLLERSGDGKFGLRDTLSLESLKNAVPVFGDRIALLLDEGGMSILEVVERYFLEYVEEKSNDHLLTWFVIVKEIDPEYRDDLDESLMEIYRGGLRLWLATGPPAPTETIETLDRSNRDPAYWTVERKEILRKEREARLASMKVPRK
ncbi:MAG: hypothetical protein E5V85_09775 [Mesorhizobium sp.]|nr:MAG: hypothetical protein E5V85_09775 [Mesorhizobium sp.]